VTVNEDGIISGISLEKVLHEIRNRVSKYKEIYECREFAVRKDIILPILQAVGWQIWDSSEVFPEFGVQGSYRVDYALCIDENPRMLLEAKNLSENPEEWLEDLRFYMELGWTPYALLTNGARWIFVQYKDKVFLDIDIMHGPIDQVSKRLRENLSQQSILAFQYVWMPPPSWTKPEAITINWGDSESKSFETISWMDAWRQCCSWLISEGIINETPIFTENERYIIAGNSRPFTEPKRIEKGFWVENKKDPKQVWKDLFLLVTTYLSSDASIEADWFEYK
jgi:hypothetical protein